MTNWYDKVSRDITQVPNAIAHYRSELGSAKVDVKISGSIERAAAAMPGIVETRFCQLQEIEAILEYLNICLKQMKRISAGYSILTYWVQATSHKLHYVK